jgi:hypothetical protein
MGGGGQPTITDLKERFVKKKLTCYLKLRGAIVMHIWIFSFSAINHTNCLQLALHLLIIILFDSFMSL